MIDYTKIAELAKKCGFTHSAQINIPGLEFLPEVRSMCNPEQCKSYNTSWSCPPACAPLDELKEKVNTYQFGVLIQTVSEVEDNYDWEGMMAAGELQKKNFAEMWKELRNEYNDIFAMGSGKCSLCKTCTYPDNPCCKPNEKEISMEACGLFVSKVCKDNGLEYNYGPGKMAYTSCFFIN